MRTGNRRPTLADVATRAGVSTALVSIVMRNAPGASPATRRHVQAVATQLGYHPDSRARLLRSGRSHLLGVVFDVQHAFHADLVTGLYSAAGKVGYELTLSAVTSQRNERTAIAGLLQDRCEALILLGPQIPASHLADLATRMPLVVMARSVRNPAIDVIRTDDSDGLHQAVDHLVRLGHRRITHVDGARAPGAAERRRGYRDAMGLHGLDSYIRIVGGGPTEEDGATAAQTLLAHPPTAVTVFNDRCAIGLLDIVHRAGRNVPNDLSVVGYDDSSLARLAHVNLTTIAQDTTTMTTEALARALHRIDGTPVPRREIVVPPQLVTRGTTGPPAAHEVGRRDAAIR